MLEIRNLTKTYKSGVRAVDNLSLRVEPGDIFGFIGPNGAGKTTTIKSVVGVMDFDEGDIFINGLSVKTDPIGCKKITAYIPDNPDLYEYYTGIAYLNFIGDVFAVESAQRETLIKKYADALELTDNLGNAIASYSHGMKQKLALISALIHSPKLLVLDEPFVGLDPKSSFTLKQIMAQMCAQGSAIFFSTHVLDVAEKLCNKIGIIKNGHLAACGDTQTVKGDTGLEAMFLELTDNA